MSIEFECLLYAKPSAEFFMYMDSVKPFDEEQKVQGG